MLTQEEDLWLELNFENVLANDQDFRAAGHPGSGYACQELYPA